MEENVNSDIEQSFSEIIDVHLKTVHGDIDTLRVSKDIKIKDLINPEVLLRNFFKQTKYTNSLSESL